MKKVAVIQFPGTNSEYETVRSLEAAGMEADFFQWNGEPSALASYDGFVIAGGFSYEDRGRSGLVASMDPIMDAIKIEATKGKPVLGICNGAQILVETGLVPGGQNNELLMSLARNKRVRNGELLGVGFYNEDVHMKSTAPKGRTAFTIDYEPGDIAWAPAAHGEGRFTSSINGLFDKLRENDQIIFRYCDTEGNIDANFPINPNGATDNAAAISNPAGNVMAIMPHPERAPQSPMPEIFTSMRKYMEGTELTGTKEALDFDEAKPELTEYAHKPNSIEILVGLIITDNEAQTIENALRLKGFDVKVTKWHHYEIDHDEVVPGEQLELAHALVNSGELLNTNKETFTFVLDDMQFKKPSDAARLFLSRDKEDSVGASKTGKIKHHGVSEKLGEVKHGWLWMIEGDADIEAILATNVFSNHHAQDLFTYAS